MSAYTALHAIILPIFYEPCIWVFIAIWESAALPQSHGCDIRIYLTNRSHFHYMRLKCAQPMQKHHCLQAKRPHFWFYSNTWRSKFIRRYVVWKNIRSAEKTQWTMWENQHHNKATKSRTKLQSSNNKNIRKSLINFRMNVTKRPNNQASYTLHTFSDCFTRATLMVIQV